MPVPPVQAGSGTSDRERTADGPDRRIVAKTSRLTLRWLQPGDAGFILELLNEPGFLEFIGDKGVRTLDDANRYLLAGPIASYHENGHGLYAVELADGTPVGICGLVKRAGLDHPDVGFAVLARHAGMGYATESAAAVLDHARRDLELERVVAITDPSNSRSRAVLEKIGIELVGRVRLDTQGEELNLFALDMPGRRR
jgi:RimJ/RimL family protein N-acetyltransferase